MFSQETIFHLVYNAILLTLFCLLHSLLAREGAKRLFDKVFDRRYYRFFYVLFSVFTLALVIVYWQAVEGMLWRAEGLLYGVMALSSSAAFLGGLYCIYVIRPLDFLGISTLRQDEHITADQAPELLTIGPYAYCRHPMYLCFGLAMILKPVMTYGDFEFLIIAVLYVAMAIPFEEKNLRNELGEIYDQYRKHVPAILPSWTPWRHRP